MQLNPEVTDADIPRVLETFLGITGRKEWERRIKWIATQVRRNEFVERSGYIAEIHPLEVEVARVFDEVQRTGYVDVRAVTPARYKLFAFAATVVGIYGQLSAPGKKRLKGMLLHGLHDAAGLSPLQQEMTVAAHLFSRGFDVHFSDIETGRGFDFLATKDSVQLEVECKRVGLSLGRKVPRWETIVLQKRIDAQVKPLFANLTCGLLLRVVLPNRLTANDTEQKAIATAVGRACATGVSVSTKLCDVEVYEFPIVGTPFERAVGQPDMPSIRDYLEERFNIKNREVYVRGETGKRALAVAVESKQADTLVPSLFAELSGSAERQFSKTRPAVLCVQFIDLTNEQIRSMDSANDGESPPRPSYIWRETSNFLASTKRAHVLSVAFRGRGNVTRSPSQRGNWLTQEVQEHGNAFFVTNETHPMANDRRYAIFGDKVPPQRILVET